MSGYWRSRLVKLLEDDVDTDQMVPARFLRTAAATGLGRFFFHDRRFDASGSERLGFPLSTLNYTGERILLAGANFGCGSSREHAPWACKDFGISAILAPSFGEIFYNNCLKNGLLAIKVEADVYAHLVATTGVVTIDLEQRQLAVDSLAWSFDIDPFAHFCLLRGMDQLEYLLQQEAWIARFEDQAAQRGVGPSLRGLAL